MKPTFRFPALLVAMALAASLAQADAPASSPAKKELIAKIVQAQQPMIEAIARTIVQQPMGQLIQAGRVVLQRMPADKREATAKAMDAEVKKFVEENVSYLKDKASKSLPATSGAYLDERFTEDELRQVLAWMESPLSKKFGQYSVDLQKSLIEKLVSEAGPTLDGRFKALQASLAKDLGLPPPPAPAAASAPAPTASPAKPVKK